MRLASDFDLGLALLFSMLATTGSAQPNHLAPRASLCAGFNTFEVMASELRNTSPTEIGFTNCGAPAAWDCLISSNVTAGLENWSILKEQCDKICLVTYTVDIDDPDVLGGGILISYCLQFGITLLFGLLPILGLVVSNHLKIIRRELDGVLITIIKKVHETNTFLSICTATGAISQLSRKDNTEQSYFLSYVMAFQASIMLASGVSVHLLVDERGAALVWRRIDYVIFSVLAVISIVLANNSDQVVQAEILIAVASIESVCGLSGTSRLEGLSTTSIPDPNFPLVIAVLTTFVAVVIAIALPLHSRLMSTTKLAKLSAAVRSKWRKSAAIRSTSHVLLSIALMAASAYSFAGLFTLRVLLNFFLDSRRLNGYTFGQIAAVVTWLDTAQALIETIWNLVRTRGTCGEEPLSDEEDGVMQLVESPDKHCAA